MRNQKETTMQNSPLMNMPSPPVKTAQQAPAKATQLGAEPADNTSFQQALMGRIQQQHNQPAQAHKQPGQAKAATQQKDVTAKAEKTEPSAESRVHQDKSSANKLTAELAADNPPETAEVDDNMDPVAEQLLAESTSVDPATINVLAQMSQAQQMAQAQQMTQAQQMKTFAQQRTAASIGENAGLSEKDLPEYLAGKSADIQADDTLDGRHGNGKAVDSFAKAATEARVSNTPIQTDKSFDKLMDQVQTSNLAKEPLLTTTQTMQATSTSQTANMAATPAQHTIMPYPGKEGWNQAIGQRVLWMVGNGQQSATLNLNPPELGPLQIVINVHNDKADTTFLSDRQEVRQALQDGMDNLREMMKEAGISLGQTNINDRSQQKQEFAQKMSSSNNGETLQTTDEMPVAAQPRVAMGLVDTFA
jgi:flagellar hook-length control protein FliK